MRGLLAEKYIDQKGKNKNTFCPDNIFRRLFISGETRFGFAFINGSQTIPLSANSCKYNGGFDNAQDNPDDQRHGVTDILLASDRGRCFYPGCDKPLDRFTGFWDPLKKKEEKVNKRLITRTAIDTVLGCASSGQLYSQRVIEEGQTFCANIEIPDDLTSELTCLISRPFVACIGTGRSRGQGWVNVRQENPLSPYISDTAKERFVRFERKGLCITLLSDAIFHDEYLRDCTAPGLSHLKPLTSMGLDLDDWEPILSSAFASNRMVFGFDGIPFQLPRVPRQVVSAGSVFLFKAKKGKGPTIPEGNGVGWIGDKNGEGFGQVVLWHPFHIEKEKEAAL